MRLWRGVVFALFLCACGESKDAGPGPVKISVPKPPDDAFGFKSAHIVYRYSGFEEGTVDAWVDDWGKTVILVRDMTKPAEKRSLMWKDGKTTLWDAVTKPVDSPFRAKDTELRLVGTNDPRQLEMAGYVKKPPETIAGQPCEVWHQPAQNVTLWRWKGIELKSINGVMETNPPVVEAQSVELDVTIPASLFPPR